MDTDSFLTGPPPPSPPQQERLTYVSPTDGPFRRFLIRMVENMSGRRKIQPFYQEILRRDLTGHEVWGNAVELLHINPVYDVQQLDKVPKEGPLVLIANHPFGVVDGLILGSLAAKLRPRFHFLVHEALIHQDRRLKDFLLPVDFREDKKAMQTNLATRRASIERLKAGEALAIFPAGGVTTRKRGFGKPEEFEWKRFVASVIHKSKATVLPIYFHGLNSLAFHLISQFSDTLRLGFLLNEVQNKIGKDIHIEIGDPLFWDDLAPFTKRQELLDHLYQVTMALGKEKP